MADEIVQKKWYESKTLWVNIIAVLAMVLAGITGFQMSAGLDVTILAMINMALRVITKDEIVW